MDRKPDPQGELMRDRLRLGGEPGWTGVLAAALVILGMVGALRFQGRLWICSCGHLYLWAGDIWSAHNSQQLFDPYAFTHVLHGLIFWGLLTWAFPYLALRLRLVAGVAAEALWEIIENSQYVIDRYREATIAQGYQGDTIVNSTGDIAACVLGLVLARRLGFRSSIGLFVLVELVLLVWIRDSLLLNVLMLLYTSEGIKAWQMGA